MLIGKDGTLDEGPRALRRGVLEVEVCLAETLVDEGGDWECGEL